MYSSIGLVVKSNAAIVGSRVRFPAGERNTSTWGLDILGMSPNPLLSRSLLRDGWCTQLIYQSSSHINILEPQHYTQYQQEQQQPLLVNRETTGHHPHYNPHCVHHSPQISGRVDAGDSWESNKYYGHLHQCDRSQQFEDDNLKLLPTVHQPRQN